MEHGYGIGITNRYSCFLESDDDPSESLKLTEADNKKKEVTTAPSTAPSQGQRKGIRDSNIKGGNTNEAQQRTNRYPGPPGERGGNRMPRPDRQNADHVDRRPPRPAGGEDREERNNRRNQDDAREYRGEGGEYSGGARRGGFPRGGSRGGVPFGRGRGPYRKREFDRQSGSDKSGVKPVDKRDGAGSRNWGTYKDDDLVEGANPTSPDESMEEKTDSQTTTVVDGDAENEKTADGEGDAPAEGEDEPKSMTLAEWKALQEQQARPKPVFNLRKAGEGEDQSQWKKMTLKTKEKENRDEDEEEEEEYSGEFPQRAGRQKQLLDIDFHFPDSRRGMAPGSGFSGPPRGDMKNRPRRPDSERGGGRGGGSPRGFRGGFRGGRGFSNRDDRPTRQMAPKVDDERDFPSLG